MGERVPVSAGRYCASCGTPRADGARFCAKCGAPFAGGLLATRPTPPVPPTPPAPRPAPRHPPWGRIGAIVVGLVVVLGAIALLAEPPPPDEQRLGLGIATAKEPEADRLIASPELGVVPADQILIQLKQGLTRADAERIAAQSAATIVGEIAFLGLYQLEIPPRSGAELTAALAKVRALDGVAAAAANDVLIPSDAQGTRCGPFASGVYATYFQDGAASGLPVSWYLTQIGAPEAWNMITASGLPLERVKVGILDTAVLSTTGEFGGAGPKLGGDTTTAPAKRRDGSPEVGGIGHGTAVAQVGFASTGNAGIAGVGGVPRSKVELLTTNVFRTRNDGIMGLPSEVPGIAMLQQAHSLAFTMTAIAGAVDQIDRGAKVVNMSFGAGWAHGQSSQIAGVWRDFLTRARSDPKTKDVVFVASAGNSGWTLDGSNHFPGGLPLSNLITVGSTDADGRVSAFSNRAGQGGEVTLAAPGSQIVVGVDADGRAIVSQGTSFSAPQVSGAAALLKSLDPSLSAVEVKDILVRTAGTRIGNAPVSPAVGAGILHVGRAVEEVVNRLRAKSGLPPMTLEDAAKLATIDVSATQTDALHWTVTAKVSGAGKDGADVKIDSVGQGGATGPMTKHLSGAGTVAWPYTFVDANGSTGITVTRLDTAACARVSFKAGGAAAATGVPTPTPTARSQPATLRGVVERARAALGWPANDPLGGMGRSDVGADRYVRVVESGGARTKITISARDLETVDAATAQFTSYVLFDRTLGPTTYRGLMAFRDLKPHLKPIPGISRDTEGIGVFKAAAGRYVFEAQVSCECAVAVPQRELDALLDAALALGFIAPGTLK